MSAYQQYASFDQAPSQRIAVVATIGDDSQGPLLWSARDNRTLHRLELGEQTVTLKTLERILNRLKCKVSDIFGAE